MVILENTKENRVVRRTCTTMALSGMYLDEEHIMNLVKVANGEKTTEELIRELKDEYVKQGR